MDIPIFLVRIENLFKHIMALAVASLPLSIIIRQSFILKCGGRLNAVVCLNIRSLLRDDYQMIRQNPAWYALILIGFIKETTLPFLICFIGGG